MKLNRSFYSRETEEVAKELLGKILVHKNCKGKIVETEAYFGDKDPASHAYRKKTKRNFLMFENPGKAYVYFCYGNHWLFNIVAKKDENPGAVLIRSLEPIEGIELMKRRRMTNEIEHLCRGPGRLTQAFEITKKQNGISVTAGGKLYILDNDCKNIKIKNSIRIGLSKGKTLKLRFYIEGNKYVSRQDVR